MAEHAPTPVVYDIHIWVLALTGPDSTYPYIPVVPPSTDNPAAYCLSIAFDAAEFAIWASPHIITNTARVLREILDNQNLIEEYISLIYETIEASGGHVIDPPRAAHDSKDHEDNLILDLVLASDANILVTDDTDLTPLNPWFGRLILRPHQFVAHVVQARRHRH